ncbi:MAG: hypothetical protein E7215_17020 [Clostridium sulfidigenes]|uniref:Uncharacterized protein n=1 Tax=Clostridium sulfidigenes TaxID=318464 RepID=A0A927ZLV6_9CLOT|nr:hypothetical protein [Clostridium sulfidigenes]
MLIRSQDKKTLINLRNIESIDIIGYKVEGTISTQDEENANTWYITYSGYEKMLFIGRYSTEAKAIKVLDMIQMANFRVEKMKMIYSYSGHLSNSCIQDFTFQMPQDDGGITWEDI